MSHFLQVLPILLLVSGLLQASTETTAAVTPLTFATPALTLTVAADQVHTGASQTVHVQLEGALTQTTVLVLTVTYPNGESVHSLHSVQGNAADITWPVPADAGDGKATFRVTTQSCNCGNHSTIPAQPIAGMEGEGVFQIVGP
ncbi:MAG: hypothetical protein R3C14_50180 [Caldilineaceae bacterium]